MVAPEEPQAPAEDNQIVPIAEAKVLIKLIDQNEYDFDVAYCAKLEVDENIFESLEASQDFRELQINHDGNFEAKFSYSILKAVTDQKFTIQLQRYPDIKDEYIKVLKTQLKSELCAILDSS